MRPAYLSTILDQEFLSARRNQHTPVMLWGPPGVGKSELVQQSAQRHSVTVVDIRLSQMEPSDLRGIPFRQNETVEWAIPALLPDVSRHGENGILFLDEITSAVPSVSAAAYQLILDRRLGEYTVPDGWSVFAAGNRLGDRGVTYAMPAPLANRFSHYTVDLNLDDWIAWAYQHEVDERIIGFLRFRPDLLFQFDHGQSPVAFPSPRSWEFAHRALAKFENQPHLLSGTLQACVGEAAGIELKAFIDSLDRMPDLDAILRGEMPDVPEEIDLQYALASALVGRAIACRDDAQRRKSIEHIVSYAGQFSQKEMGVMLVSDLIRAMGEDVYAAPAFSAWAETIGDIMLY
ncbi:MAG: MoxR family ATPase [Granulosicoccus sp.]